MKSYIHKRVAVALFSSAMLAGCASNGISSHAKRGIDIVSEPALVLVRASGSPSFVAVDGSGSTGAIYETRLRIEQVLAGRMSNREWDVVRVRLMTGNVGYLARDVQLVVILDPVRMSQSLPLYWRPLSTFACVETVELERLGLKVGSLKKFTFESDTCQP